MSDRKRPTNIGGQAVIEGVMMRGKKIYAMAVRNPEGEIVVEKKPVGGLGKKGLFRYPIFRGMAAFVDSLVTGTKILMRSAEIAGEGWEEEELSPFEQWLKEKLGINALNTKMNNYVTIKNFTQKITLKSGIATVKISAALDGYTLLGIVRCSFASSYLTTTGYTLSGNNLSLNVRDVSAPTTSTASANCYVTALYVKN